ncbi:hypothetical protein B0G81_3391 [Paraburkholderia sp. BL6665CI2N2]|uniref:hypothetical protein n=1 Tax=Paraburkholderia sp. BL6665CI2N2 TaxID=1938806 RepID=UPI0010E85150|nr:hypothetical protein [Paraburkholderia sp. BL6665CI2N2]TDY23061.1 hypothetical protein B0G81_3391 [Paraburkholderia sp. BL6665CI2N2]
MYYEHTNFQNTDAESGTNDPNKFDSVKNPVVEATSPNSARNWAWAHSGDAYDWMDWHSPFPAATPSE